MGEGGVHFLAITRVDYPVFRALAAFTASTQIARMRLLDF